MCSDCNHLGQDSSTLEEYIKVLKKEEEQLSVQ